MVRFMEMLHTRGSINALKKHLNQTYFVEICLVNGPVMKKPMDPIDQHVGKQHEEDEIS